MSNIFSVLISDAESIFTSVTSAVGSQASVAATATTSSTDNTSTTSSASSTSSSTTSTSASSTISSSASLSSATAASSSSAAAASSTQNPHHDRTLAIILGTVLGALLLGALILLLLLLCRRRRKQAARNKRFSGYNSSTEDIVLNEKHRQRKQHSSFFNGRPTTYQNYHRGSKNSVEADRYPSGIPAPHGFNDNPYLSAVSNPRRHEPVYNHERGMFSVVTDKNPTHSYHEISPLATSLGGATLGAAGSHHYRNSGNYDVERPDEHTHSFIQPPPRSPLRNSMDSTDMRRRSASMSRDRASTPQRQVHDPMPTGTVGLAAGTLMGSALLAERERHRSRSRSRPAPGRSGLVSPIPKDEPVTTVHEIGDSSDDRDIDRLRRTGTLSPRAGTRSRDVTELHELSSTGSSNAVPTLASLQRDNNNVGAGHQQPTLSNHPAIKASHTQTQPNLYPTPLDPSLGTQRYSSAERPISMTNTDEAYTNRNSRSDSSVEPSNSTSTQNSAPLEHPQEIHATKTPQGSLLVSGILKVIDQPEPIPHTQTPTSRPNRLSTDERRKSRTNRRSGSSFKNAIVITDKNNHDDGFENIPLRPKSQQEESWWKSDHSRPQSQTTLHSQRPASRVSDPNPNPYKAEAPSHFLTTLPGDKTHDITDVDHSATGGRWDDSGRWRSFEHLRGTDHMVGQAL